MRHAVAVFSASLGQGDASRIVLRFGRTATVECGGMGCCAIEGYASKSEPQGVSKTGGYAEALTDGAAVAVGS